MGLGRDIYLVLGQWQYSWTFAIPGHRICDGLSVDIAATKRWSTIRGVNEPVNNFPATLIISLNMEAVTP